MHFPIPDHTTSYPGSTESFPPILGLSSIIYKMDMTKLPSLSKLTGDFAGHRRPSEY